MTVRYRGRMATDRYWPMAVLDPKRKYTTDRYQRGGAYADPHKNP